MIRRTRHGLAATLLVAALLAAGAGPLSAQQAKVIAEAADDYQSYCAACHGPQGHGDGEMAAKLATPPSDLTKISQGSEPFPFWRIYSVIAGDVAVPGHDTFQMPQFVERLKADEHKPGYLPAHIRILLLTHYVESLQAR